MHNLNRDYQNPKILDEEDSFEEEELEDVSEVLEEELRED